MSDYSVLWEISIKYLPIEAWNKLADLLDPPNGDISMEIFAQRIDQSQNHRLLLTSDKLNGFRFGHIGQRPTIVLLNHLQKHRITVGLLKYVLDNMGADTARIFDPYQQSILASHAADIRTAESLARQSQSYCSCLDCQRQNEQARQHTSHSQASRQRREHQTGQMSGSVPQRNSQLDHREDQTRRVGSEQQPSSHRSLLPSDISTHPRDGNEYQDWSPPICGCLSINCQECENRRLAEDSEETIVIQQSVRSASRIREIRSQTMSSSTRTEEIPLISTNDDNGSEQVNDISYTEFPSISQRLYATPHDVPQSRTNNQFSTNCKSLTTNNGEMRCTCILPSNPRMCSCKSFKKADKCTKTTGSISKEIRWSTGNKLFCNGNSLSETTSGSESKSVSDTDIRYPNENQNNISGRRLLISYTDDVSPQAEELAESLKHGGHKVCIDIQKSAFTKAYNMGLVSENDQFAWLHEKYKNSDYIIVCSSKGYKECLNLENACPSSKYLNAKFIYDLISKDLECDERVIQLCFNVSHHEAIWCLQCPKRFLLPRESYRLKMLLNDRK